jgi:hypothetical protein
MVGLHRRCPCWRVPLGLGFRPSAARPVGTGAGGVIYEVKALARPDGPVVVRPPGWPRDRVIEHSRGL